jgi:hypothetical protein
MAVLVRLRSGRETANKSWKTSEPNTFWSPPRDIAASHLYRSGYGANRPHRFRAG